MYNKLISIIIPVYNEAGNIGRLVENLKSLQGEYEIIFVDGGSTDDTVKIIKEQFSIFCSPKKGRAFQMNYGAEKAKGHILLFLHADSLLQKNAAGAIYNVLDKGYRSGCFKIQFDSKSFLMKICAFMSTLRVRLRSIAFGDQGIFIEKEYFCNLGGFKGIPIMEDYRLSMDIKKNKQRIGLADSYIITSERRFQAGGRLKTMWKMQKLQYMYRNGADIELIVKLYK